MSDAIDDESSHPAREAAAIEDDGLAEPSADGPSAPGLAAPADRPPTQRGRRIVGDLELLRGLAVHGSENGVGVVRLAAIVGRDKGQVSRSLKALTEAGLAERDPETARFHLGPEVYALAAATARTRLLTVSPEILRTLAAELGLAVNLCVASGQSVVTVRSEAPPSRAAAWGPWDGASIPAHASSGGRVLLAGLPACAVRQRYGEGAWATETPHCAVRSVDELLAVLDEVRDAGFALVRGEVVPGLGGVSAPVFDFRGDRIAGLNVNGTVAEIDADQDRIVESVRAAAVRLSHRLGADPQVLRRHGG